MEELNKQGRIDVAAMKADMDRNTARKYIEAGKLPSEMQASRDWRTRPDPFEEDWPRLAAMLQETPELEAKTLFEQLTEERPGRYEPGQLRTLQRRVQRWRTTPTAETKDTLTLPQRLALAEREIAALRGQIARARAMLESPASAGSEPRCSFCGRARHKVQKLISAGGVFICDACVGLCNATLAQKKGAAVSTPSPAPPATQSQKGQPPLGESRPPVQPPKLLKGQRRILAALASLRPRAVSRAQVALLAGFAPQSGTFGNYLSELRQQHLMEELGRLLRITEAGIRLLGEDCPQRAATTAELLAVWKPRFTGAAKLMLDLVVQAYPQALSREDLAQRAGLSSSSGTFGNYLSKLRTSGLVEDAGRLIRACAALFPEAISEPADGDR